MYACYFVTCGAYIGSWYILAIVSQRCNSGNKEKRFLRE